MLKVSETYLVGVDLAEVQKDSMVTIDRIEGGKRVTTNVIQGEAAEIFYNTIINPKNE